MPYVPAGQKNPRISIPPNLSRRDAIFPVKLALSRNPNCGLSNALHFQTSAWTGQIAIKTIITRSGNREYMYNDVVKCVDSH